MNQSTLATPLSCLLSALMCLVPSITHADDPVLIVPHGGVRAFPSLEIIEEQVDTWRVVPGADLHVLPEDAPLDVFSEVKILPNQTALVAGFEQLPLAQITVVDPVQDTRTVVWQADNTFSRIDSVSVATSLTPGDPSRLLLADSNTSLVQIWDRGQGTFVWRQSVYIQGARALFVQAIALPGNRIVSAANWPSIGTGGMDIFNLAPGPDELATFRIASKTYEGAPDTLRIQPALVDIRDVMALDAQTLLVTTAQSIFTMNLDAEIGWSINLSELDALHGELAGARVTPSGRIVAATFEPGKWTQPHTNHRVHWFEAPIDATTAPRLIASSSPLDRAPKRIASAQSTGGTGTQGFEGGFDDSGGDGDVNALTLGSAIMLESDRVAPGDDLIASVSFSNPTSMPITPKRFVIRGVPGTNCQASLFSNFTLLESEDSPLVSPLGVYTLQGAWPITQDTSKGPWCIFPAIQREDGSWRNFNGTTTSITVLGGEEGDPVPNEQLPFKEFDPGAPQDMAGSQMNPDMGPLLVTFEDEDDGCGCQQTHKAPSPPLEMLWFSCFAMCVLARQRWRAR